MPPQTIYLGITAYSKKRLEETQITENKSLKCEYKLFVSVSLDIEKKKKLPNKQKTDYSVTPLFLPFLWNVA